MEEHKKELKIKNPKARSFSNLQLTTCPKKRKKIKIKIKTKKLKK